MLREVERWLAEARVAAVQVQMLMHPGEIASGLSSYRARQQPGDSAAAVVDNGDDGEGEELELEPREAWALDRLCDALLVKGALVPISRKSVIITSPVFHPLSPRRGNEKKKRTCSTNAIFFFRSRKRISGKENAHHPPPSLLVIWTPLLESVAANHAHFPTIITSRIVAHLLLDDNPTAEPSKPDDATSAATAAAEKASYDVCLATWAAWLIEWRRSADETDADVTARRQNVFFQLAQALVAPKHEEKPLRFQKTG